MNDIRALIPPGFKDRAISTNMATAYNLNIPQLYIHKNPAWHPLTINEADVLDPEVVMPRLNQDRLFAPDSEDVMLLEREVNLYRLQMRDDELEQLQEQRRELLRHLNEMNQDDFDDQLHEIDARIRARQQELNETERKMREMELENERLERELAMRPVVTTYVTPVAPPRPVPQVVTRVVEERPRSRSPGRNILPSLISGLPQQSETRKGFNYEGDQGGLNSSVRGELILNRPLNNSSGFSGIDDNRFGTRPSAIQPMRDSYSTRPQVQYAPAPQIALPRMVAQGPQPPMMQSVPLQGGYTSGPFMQAGPQIRSSNTVINGNPVPASISQGRTYRINGQTYTDATLPPQYAHLRGN
jgi:hypothetical protein